MKEKIEECLIPTPGVCMNPVRLTELNCEDCKYWEGCTNINKGKMAVTENKGNKEKNKNSKGMKRKR